jgi:hypothetical protein
MTALDHKNAKAADIRLRAILSFWHQSSRYRSKAVKQHRSHPVSPQARLTSIENLRTHASNGNGS